MTEQDLAYLVIGAAAVVMVAFAILLITVLHSIPKTLAAIVDNLLDRLTRGIQRHTVVTEIVTLIEQFRHDPELVQQLESYTDQQVAAVLSYHVTSLSYQHQRLMNQIAENRRMGLFVTARAIQQEADLIMQRLEDLQDMIHRRFAVS